MNNRTTNIAVSTVIILCLLQATVYSQKISAHVNRSRIFIGEQIFMKLSLEETHPGREWFQFADTLNHLEVVSRSKIDTVSKGGYTNYYQTIVLTSFDSGQWQFPALAIAGINQITMPISIDVVPVDVSKKKDYNEIKDIEEVTLKTNRILIATLLALTLFSLSMLILLVAKKKKGIAAKPLLKNNQTPLQWAISELEKLHKPDADVLLELKHYYAELNRISRTFFSLQLHHNNQSLTTDEWMVNLQQLSIDNSYKTPFFQYLRLADSVRFAKFLPPAYENYAALDTVKNLLEKTALLPSDIHSEYQPKIV